MKKSILFFVKTILVLSLVFAAGCKTDEDKDKNGGSDSGNDTETVVPDPEGTVTVLVRNSNNGSTSVTTSFGGFGIDEGNNFCSANTQFASVGKKQGLGDITKIPENGWAEQVAVTPGHGYVGRLKTSYGPYEQPPVVYIRIYVVDYIKSTSGGIMGAKIKYQDPFRP